MRASGPDLPVTGDAQRVGRTHHPKTDIVVAIIGIVPVAVRGARIVWIIVPGTAAQHPRFVAGTPHR